MSNNMAFLIEVLIRLFLAVLVGGMIGSERARHGRAAGLRTHILVCIGGAVTALTGVYVSDVMGYGGDVLRISAQVISGIGFLGAGMIILKNNNTIMGLTTAAGVWTTSIIGIALGYGFYSGALIAALLAFTAVTFFSKFERKRKQSEVLYIEIDDMYHANQLVKEIEGVVEIEITHTFMPPKSKAQGHLGIRVTADDSIHDKIDALCEIEGVVFVEGE
ncbi:MAG: MgtC/SapB family protein [Ruminococcaceae bacterium]|nr:MgtC/SapB family protein [Oscillospiraceae bacterium]